jgi:cell division protein FtsZ
LGLFEISEAAELVAASAHPDANIIYGTVIDDALGDEVRVTVIAAGFDSGEPTKIEVPVIETPVAPVREKNDPVEVAAAITATGALGGGATRKRIIFEEDDSIEELDVPDFLK